MNSTATATIYKIQRYSKEMFHEFKSYSKEILGEYKSQQESQRDIVTMYNKFVDKYKITYETQIIFLLVVIILYLAYSVQMLKIKNREKNREDEENEETIDYILFVRSVKENIMRNNPEMSNTDALILISKLWRIIKYKENSNSENSENSNIKKRLRNYKRLQT
jgi:hypothetical protein